MAITSRIVKVKTATWSGTARDGIREVGFTVRIERRAGQAGNEAGPTTMNKVRYRVTGYIVTDNLALGLALCTGATGILVATGELVGGQTVTLTIGRTASSITSGVIFTSTGEHSYDILETGANSPSIRIPFEGVFHPADTQLVNAAANGLITIAAA